MSKWDFEEMGEFGSDADADRWAKRNNIAPQDVASVEVMDFATDIDIQRVFSLLPR